MKDIELYWNDDHTKYAVLVSYGFGSGFSTWSDAKLAYDKRVVEFWLAHKDNKTWMYLTGDLRSKEYHEAEAFFSSIGYDYVPMLGFNDIELKWVPRGAKWIIEEYDGAESLRFRNNIDWNYVD